MAFLEVSRLYCQIAKGRSEIAHRETGVDGEDGEDGADGDDGVDGGLTMALLSIGTILVSGLLGNSEGR